MGLRSSVLQELKERFLPEGETQDYDFDICEGSISAKGPYRAAFKGVQENRIDLREVIREFKNPCTADIVDFIINGMSV